MFVEKNELRKGKKENMKLSLIAHVKSIFTLSQIYLFLLSKLSYLNTMIFLELSFQLGKIILLNDAKQKSNKCN